MCRYHSLVLSVHTEKPFYRESGSMICSETRTVEDSPDKKKDPLDCAHHHFMSRPVREIGIIGPVLESEEVSFHLKR